MSESAREMLAGLLSDARLSAPDDVVTLLADRGTALGADDVTVYLVDHEQYALVPVPVPPPSGEPREPLSIEATLAGRCFRNLELQKANEGREVWVPLLDGLERLGVVRLEFADAGARAEDELLHAFGATIAEMVLTKGAYGDLFTVVRRRQPMSLAGEITWNLMPPLTFGTERVVISCVLAPAYDVGGDSFDYAVDASTARLAVFDAMGHGLNAGLLATVAIAAYRRARRTGLDLARTVTAVDAAVADTFTGEQFVTGLFAELDLATGHLAWHSAGHPAPLLLRGTRVIGALDTEPALPLGLGMALGTTVRIEEQSLEPGDRLLLYSDGVVEARDADGEFFGADRLADLVGRETAAGQPAPETMRRLMHAILDHQAGSLQDDATTMLVEWRTGGQQRITPD
jgi:Stage II sporulation protein E (SpoIIE)